MKAVLYARVSTTDKQDPEMQLAELREYASRRGWELCGTFVDRTSGTRESRPALDEGLPAREAVRRANLYAGLSTTGIGTQKSFYDRARFDAEWTARSKS